MSGANDATSPGSVPDVYLIVRMRAPRKAKERLPKACVHHLKLTAPDGALGGSGQHDLIGLQKALSLDDSTGTAV
jgi:hypothetical protein